MNNIVIGHALGDAVGLIQEFKPPCDVEKIVFPYTEPIRLWSACDWTDDTDNLIVLMLALKNLSPDNIDETIIKFASSLRHWINYGFKELGDVRGMGVGGTISEVTANEHWLSAPELIAKEVWLNTECRVASNGAIMRCSVCYNLPYDIIARFCMATHYDPRCQLSCVTQCIMLKSLIDGKYYSHTKIKEMALTWFAKFKSLQFSGIMKHRCPAIWTVYDYDDTVQKFSALFENMSYAQLKLHDNIGYTFKTLGTAIVTYKFLIASRHFVHTTDTFKKVISKIASQGGDADTNCAPSGALLGAVVPLPDDWVNVMPNIKWLKSILIKN